MPENSFAFQLLNFHQFPCDFNHSLIEKSDVDALENNRDTHKLFLEQGTLEEKKSKELAEYIDAKNKEVIALTPFC